MLTGNIVTDVTVFVLAALGLTILGAQEYANHKDRRRWRKK